MPSEKRQRQDEGRLLRLEAQRAATRKDQRKGQLRTLLLLLGAVVVVAGGIAIFSGGDDESTSTTGSTTTTTAVPGASVEIPLPEPGRALTGETPCPAADGSSERTTSFELGPTYCLDDTKRYTATLVTSEGDIVIELDSQASPVTVNSFVVLARYHFYDGVAFHRIIPGFVNQTGDPVGPTPGTGGPGFMIPDEPPADPTTAYQPGTVAMARTSEPNSAGSQFFIVIGDANGALASAGNYAVLGRVTEGQDVADAINAFGTDSEAGEPTKVVTVETVLITETAGG